MRTSGPGICEARAGARAGFTLLEVLVVVALLGIAAAIGVAALTRDERGTLEREARRFAGALELALQRAQIAHETLGVSAHGDGWQFWRRGEDGRWVVLAGDDALAPHALPEAVALAALAYAGRPLAPDAVVPLRASGRNEPAAFVLRARGFEATVATDPHNRVAIVGPRAP